MHFVFSILPFITKVIVKGISITFFKKVTRIL